MAQGAEAGQDQRRGWFDKEAVTRQVNALEAVAHNYRRDHALNMWFVLATESPAAMQAAVARIEADTGLEVHVFPKLQEYFVGMRFTVGGHQPVGRALEPGGDGGVEVGHSAIMTGRAHARPCWATHDACRPA